MSAHEFRFEAIDGGTIALADYAGKAVLVVNTASECGFTPQYEGLQRLWSEVKDRGLVVLGVPSNDFGGQEPGDEEQVRSFCATRFGVDFPLTAKQHVIGGDAHPFYKWIEGELGEDMLPRWNFHKYLVGPDGALAGAWPSKVEPNDDAILQAVDAALRG